VRQSCGKAKEVIVYSYGGRTAEVWWDKIKNSTSRFEKLKVINLDEAETNERAQQAKRSMKLQVNIQSLGCHSINTVTGLMLSVRDLVG
jgi:uncharacterized protein YaeQ